MKNDTESSTNILYIIYIKQKKEQSIEVYVDLTHHIIAILLNEIYKFNIGAYTAKKTINARAWLGSSGCWVEELQMKINKNAQV